MSSELTITYIDYSLERSSAKFRGVDLTAVNFDPQNILMNVLAAACQDIVLGTKVKEARLASVTTFTETKPASPFAQRENKWLVRYTDNVDPNGDGSLEIPTPDLSLLNLAGTFLDLTTAEGAAFETAFNNYQRSRLGNAVTLVSVQYVGRNN